jgi:hypothetical protein
MAFDTGCACHVWAIDGWLDDELASEVNENYNNSANAMLFHRPPGGLTGRITRLLQDCRRTPPVAQAGRLWGGFQRVDDGAPEHMWFEYNGYLYDTMPGSPVRRIAATEWTRRRPPSEEAEFPANRVASIPFSLTATQHHIVTTAVWAPIAIGGRTIHQYHPPG